MASASSGMVAVTLSVPPALEERVIDWLLARPELGTFTSRAVYRYGADARDLSATEQVSGRQRRVEITTEMQAEGVESWLRDFATAFVAMGVEYTVTPIIRSGHLRDLSSREAEGRDAAVI